MNSHTKIYQLDSIPTSKCIDEAFLKGCILQIIAKLRKKTSFPIQVIKRIKDHYGLTLFCTFDDEHIVLTSYGLDKKVIIHVYSITQNAIHLTEDIGYYFSIRPSSIEILNTIDSSFSECREARCKDRATYSWEGLKVCQDHYEQYQQKYEDDLDSLDNY
jgi:hypothetical protein